MEGRAMTQTQRTPRDYTHLNVVFSDVASGLKPGIYDASELNPPSGDDCAYLLVTDSGRLYWCDREGVSAGGDGFTANDLCGGDNDLT